MWKSTRGGMACAGHFLTLSMACLLAGCGHPETPNQGEPPAKVKWEKPRRGKLEEWVELAGATTPLPDRIARVSAPVEGRVVSILDNGGKPIAEGQWVERGAVLAQLDATVIQANLAKSQAVQEVLREEQLQAKYAVELAQSDVDRLAKLKAEEDSGSPGRRTQLVSPVDRLKADFALKDARSKLKAATGKLAAGVKEIESLQAQRKFHTLTAPISGHVGRVQVVPGQTLAVGTLVAEIIDLDEQIDVLCFVPPSMIGRFEIGQSAQLGGFDAGAAALAGRIAFVANQAEPETGNFAIKVRFSNRDAHLKSNRVIRLRVRTRSNRDCLSLPERAIQEDEEIPTVVIAQSEAEKNAKGEEATVVRARRMRVVLGLRDRGRHRVEVVRLEDAEKDPAKKLQRDLRDTLFVVQGGEGLQTGDELKQEADGE